MPRVKKIELGEGTTIVTKELIALLDLDLGREDLNKLVGKVNEIVKKLNE